MLISSGVHHISEGVLSILGGRIRMNLDPIFYSIPAKIRFRVEFHVIPDTFMFIS